MRSPYKQTLTTVLAIGLLGCAVMFSVSSAEGPFRPASDNAFGGSPLGHPDKALVSTHWLDDCTVQAAPVTQAAFDWGFPVDDACPKCGFKDAKVTPVVLDVPELLGPSDATAIEVIKRKLGINAFRGSIFEDPAPPTAQLVPQGAPLELKSQTCESGCCSHSATTLSTAALGVCNAECGACVAARSGATVASECLSTRSGEVAVEMAPNDKSCSGSGECAQSLPKNIGVPGNWVAYSFEGDPVAALREASFGLDEAAKQLEASDRYDAADQLRQAAQELRLKARQMKQNQHTANAKASPDKPAVHATSYWWGQRAAPESFIYPATNVEAAQPHEFQSPYGASQRVE